MESSNIYALFLICVLFIFSATTPVLGCGFCGTTPPMPTSPPPKAKTPITPPPKTVPPVKPPVTPPPTVKPPVTPPPTVKPPVIIPPIVLPPVILPPIVLPPVTLPPIPLPPILTPPPAGPPPPPANETCPIDTLKLGNCVNLLGGLVHIGLRDPVVNECCPLLQGLAGTEAAACLCTTLKRMPLNLNSFVPLAVQLLSTCGKTPPPGYTCSM